jgi:hypothetical protein
MNKIQQEFIDKGAVKMRPNGKWFVLSKENAIAFVEACKRASISILGVDGFYLSDEMILPSMEDSIDFTTPYYKTLKDIYSDAIEFLNQRDKSMYFEIVCSKEE